MHSKDKLADEFAKQLPGSFEFTEAKTYFMAGYDAAHHRQAAFEIVAEHMKRHKALVDKTIGPWLSAALDDEIVCGAMKEDIRAFFKAIE
jgi:hypothetical protein